MQSPDNQKHLEIGESIIKQIYANKIWNDTNIMMLQGESYHFKASGKWIDFTNPCDANGYPSNNFILRANEKRRRSPNANWFALIGAIERSQQSFFTIGGEKTKFISNSGLFSCFANDVIFMYWNNCGTIELTIRRLK